jgi:hypothetical protein
MAFRHGLLLITLAAAPFAAGPAAAARCVSVQDIRSATSRDGNVLRMEMRNGSIVDARMAGACKGLRFGGFSWVILDGLVCENMQSLQVLQTGEICNLGKFDSPTRTPKK